MTAAVVFLAFPMPEAYNMSLLPGEIADRDVKADRDFMVNDEVTMEKMRETAVRSSPAVFDLDDMSAAGVQEIVRSLFERGRTIYNAPKIVSPVFSSGQPVQEPDATELERLKTSFNSAFNLDDNSQTFNVLAQIGFSIPAERTVLRLVMDLLNQGVVAEKRLLLDQTSNGIVVRLINSKQESLVPYPTLFPSLQEARRLVRERALLYAADFEPDQTKAIIAVAQSLLRPTLVLNQAETEQRRGAAVAQVAPVFFRVKRGEMIVREGQRVDLLTREKLMALAGKADRGDWLFKACGFFLLSFIFLFVTTSVIPRIGRSVRLLDRDFAFLASLLLINLVIAYVAVAIGNVVGRNLPGVTKLTILYLSPLAAGAMLSTIFIGPLTGIFFSVVSSALAALVFDLSLPAFFYFFLGSIVGLVGVVQVRDRGGVVRTGLLVGLVNLGTITAFGFLDKTLLGSGVWFNLLAGFLSGLLSGVVATGLLPLFEMAFRYTTNVKLLELANLDRPILRELMLQAPGTYHHSVIVGAMVEAAAEAIGANPLLAKVSAYYHDLGKMKKPLYFIENQVSGENKHEKLAPSMSALILISHVKDGLELARRHKLSPEITNILQQHHGTSLISYFYQKAKDSRTSDAPEINIEDYRYPGPKPQTREAGLVMLADAVEAASRSLGEANPARVQGMVQKLINNIFSDGQLDECELTLKDLHLIARSFNKILTAIFHRRIEYPEPAAKEASARTKTAHANSSKQPPKDSSDQDRPDKEPRKEDLKRLGMS
ncbi:MAG: HDIG domain-containing metalloprotein [Pseudomonadota bacterium]